MKKTIILNLLFTIAAFAGVPLDWSVDVTRVEPIRLDAYHGETLDLSATLMQGRARLAVPAGSATFLWQTNGMGAAWWQTNATVSADGVVRGTFGPAMDTGADAMRFFFSVVSGSGANYRAAGTIALRPSPGASPTTADLAPQTAINFADYQLVNAPWITATDAAESVRAATNALETALQARDNSLETAIQDAARAASNYTDVAVTDVSARLVAATNAVSEAGSAALVAASTSASNYTDAAVAAIDIPSLTGYATEAWVQGRGYLTDHQSLSGYATEAWTRQAISNALPVVPSLDGYATEAWVTNRGYLTSHQPLTGYATEAWVQGRGYLTDHQSLSGYATEAWTRQAISNALPVVPSLAGYATESWVQGQGYLTSHQPLTGYATEAWVQGRGYLTDHQSLSGYATEAYASDAATGAREAAEAYARSLSWGSAAGNTRLVTLDGSTWQDATGTVWQVSDVYGWAGTVIDLSTSAARPITFSYAGKTLAAPDNISLPTDYWTAGDGTNLYYDSQMTTYWILWMTNDYHGTTGDYWSASGTPAPSLTATNLSFNTAFEQYTLFWCPVSLATNPVDRVLYASGGVSADLGEFARTNDVLNAGPYLALTGGVIRAAGGPRIRLEGTGAMLGGMPTYVELSSIGIDVVGVYAFNWLHIDGNGFRMNNQSGDGGLFSFPYEAYETGGTIALRSDLPDTASITNDIADIRTESALVYRLYSGSNVVAEVTNYNSQVHAPSLRLLQLNESNEYVTVWTETNGLARTLAAATNYADEAISERAAPRAWSGTTSGLGFDAPDGMTWVSSSNLVIAGGLEYEKHVTTGGAIWLLESNGMTADFHALSNNTAYLDISAADGTSIFRIEKSDSFLVGVHVNNVSVDGSTLVCGVNVVAAEHPLVRVKAQLTDASWSKEEDGTTSGGVTTIPGLATITWSGSSGNWTCRIANLTGGGSLFAQMEYLQEGGTKIVNTAPLDVTPGILCTDGVHKVRPVYNNGTITWEVVP